jgi:hypothetical protein
VTTEPTAPPLGTDTLTWLRDRAIEANDDLPRLRQQVAELANQERILREQLAVVARDGLEAQDHLRNAELNAANIPPFLDASRRAAGVELPARDAEPRPTEAIPTVTAELPLGLAQPRTASSIANQMQSALSPEALAEAAAKDGGAPFRDDTEDGPDE